MTRKSQRHKALQRQVDRIKRHLQALKTRSSWFSRLRLLTFLAGSGLGIATNFLVAEWLGWIFIGLTMVIFNVEAYFHRKIIRAVKQNKIWLKIKLTQLARMQLKWTNITVPQTSASSETHPFLDDLDITGERSLHQLLDLSVSRDGSQMLLDWLQATDPDLETTKIRQQIVREMTPLARFRDKLLLAFYMVSKEQLEGKKLLNYLRRSHLAKSFQWVLTWSFALACINIVLFTLSNLNLMPAFWVFSLMLYVIVYFMNFRRVASLLHDAVIIAEELRKLKAVLLYLEKHRYGHCEKLRTHCQVFWQSQSSPSGQLKRIAVLNTLVGLRMNPVGWFLLNIGLPYDFFVIKLMDVLKKRLVLVLADWLTALAELEALSSLANYAYLNPHTTFPKLLAYSPGLNGKVFCAEDMGHPLLPDNIKKRNDFHFARSGEVALITGSNMSGKSTFIKTVGVNLCLAYAGGPVDATSFETAIFRLYTCIKINDSITDGFSFFYAEVKRLKSLLNALRCSNERPLLFLIDEIFKGTNNRERLIGARSYVRALAGQNGLGFIATHDLELTVLAHSIQQLANYHFREEVQNGMMVFDYRIRSGPCPTTNALKIMEMEGLPMDGQAMTS